MGNGIGKHCICCSAGFRKHDVAAIQSEPLDEGLGHSFCYVRPDTCHTSSSKVHSETTTTTTFRTISGASVSANTSTPLSTSVIDMYSYNSLDRAAAFESSTSFASIPLQPVPKCLLKSDSMCRISGFLSGPIERGFVSGPLDKGGMFSGNLEKGCDQNKFQRSFSYGGGFGYGKRFKKESLIHGIRKAIAKKMCRGQNSIVAPVKGIVCLKDTDWINGLDSNGTCMSSEGSLEDVESLESQNLQWAQGKAGEDRVHVVISEEHGWVFVGIYDGFNGPDAPDFLVSNLYPAVQKELKGLLWDDKYDSATDTPTIATSPSEDLNSEKDVSCNINGFDMSRSRNEAVESCSKYVECESYPKDLKLNTKKGRDKSSKNRFKGVAKRWEERQKKWKHEWDKERVELDQMLKEQLNRSAPKGAAGVNHGDVMKALSQALKKTEEAYLDITDMMSMENPELALMGSCVLVMLMKGEDVYVMNVGDSRAVLAQKAEPDFMLGKAHHDLERINEETLNDLEAGDGNEVDGSQNLNSLQLTKDHSTSIAEEVKRIRNEHQDDISAVTNDRVKGSLKVTRAFGAGFLKQFIASSPEGDPAQHLVEELLFRAAKKAGLDFYELLEIPQGDRRRYHDDVSIIVISLEGRIWRSWDVVLSECPVPTAVLENMNSTEDIRKA
ncbi:hypothetical protein IFM89_036611 [Coptis chinensis]|uniref:PPM-type phosphatase domain-containing protein n=1 Tax=Coptis chinensis TaxID=261450 RepID=A0A835HJL4_9MAGN|nr:hypothetical protein IFM89_036611 [Coptis chinensis]